MASFRKSGKGWRAEVLRRGIRKSATFPTKGEARAWAAEVEREILGGDGVAAKAPLSEVFDRYAREVSIDKAGARWEQGQLSRMAVNDLGSVRVCDLTPERLARWRDERLQSVSAGTVRREMVLLSHVLTVARREWGMLQANPMSDVRRPPEPRARDRLPTSAEMERLAFVAGDDLSLGQARAFHAFLFALETAMRAGEIVGLTWDCVDLESRVAHLPMTKNGTARDVPLSSEAVRLLEVLPRSDPVFGLSSSRLDALWRKIRDKAGADGLRFHDSRHAAITRLARKLEVLDLARMVGHRDIRELMTYYNPSAAEIAGRLG